MPDEISEKMPDLSISPEKVCYIIAKAREFDAKDVVTEGKIWILPGSVSMPSMNCARRQRSVNKTRSSDHLPTNSS